ncbi:cupin-like domain-containing protein [Nocardia sp. NPDC004582]
MTWNSVDRVSSLDRDKFYSEYVSKGKPVVLENQTAGWPARKWTPDFFRNLDCQVELGVKKGNVADGERTKMTLADYIDLLEQDAARIEAGEPSQNPGYLHDVPLFRAFPELIADADPFPMHLMPEWYGERWHEYTQHFIGPSGSVTPLHFDTLLTHNLFFHLYGRKQFILMPAEQKDLCYLRSWRWANYDPAAPDYEKFPQAANITPVTVVLEPGDVLYMPPGTMHHVTNLTMTIAFNIDWHTAQSARRGIGSVLRGAPMMNGYYNTLMYLGLGLGIPEKTIFRYYKSYLTYVS